MTGPIEITKKSALKFIILFGVISLFADITYEGARSITGPFLATLGASATVVGFVAGLGEFIGYGLRLISGYITDRTKQYWLLTIIGYSVNLIAVPLLGLTGNWGLAAALIIAERIGKAIRTPSRDAMLSYATKRIGTGFGFGLHEAMDRVGALTGPLIVTAVLYFKGSYRMGFVALALPALLAIAILLVAKFIYPHPHHFEIKKFDLETKSLPHEFWIYLAAVALVAAGYVDFPLIAYHFKKWSIVSDIWIPVFYSVAMGVEGLSSLVFGRLFDRIGLSILIFVSFVAAFFAPFVFWGGFGLALLGMALWGIGMGAQSSVMRAVVADMVPANRRGSAYGIFNTGYGLFWFLGSALMGFLYDRALPFLIAFSMVMQFGSVLFLVLVGKRMTRK